MGVLIFLDRKCNKTAIPFTYKILTMSFVLYLYYIYIIMALCSRIAILFLIIEMQTKYV